MEWLMALAIILVVKFKLYVCISFRHHPSVRLQPAPKFSKRLEPVSKVLQFPPLCLVPSIYCVEMNIVMCEEGVTLREY